MSGLSSLGWDERAARAVAEICVAGCVPGRVVRVDLDSVVVSTEGGERRARARELPTVGDWVVVDVREQDALVVGVARQWSELSRRDPAGRTQVLAANVDLVLVTAPADRLSVARVEREVAMGWDSGARPVVLLTKSDLAPTGLFDQVRSRLVGVEVVPVSTVTGVGAGHVAEMLRPAHTAVMLGPSGAGKSSLANLLLGRGAAPTGQVRPGDHRGRHVTSSRGLYAVPTGGVIIDTPGLRSLSLSIDRGGVTAAFPDIEALASQCRFADCRHELSPTAPCLPQSRTERSTAVAWRTTESFVESSSSRCGATTRPQPGRTDRSGRTGASPPDGSATSAGTDLVAGAEPEEAERTPQNR